MDTLEDGFGCLLFLAVLFVAGWLALGSYDYLRYGIRDEVRQATFDCRAKNMDATRKDYSTQVACVSKKLQDSVRVEMKQ